VRISEIASAEEQIELWKLISTSVWQSLQKQQQAELTRKSQAQVKKRAVPKGKRPSIQAKATPTPLPPKATQGVRPTQPWVSSKPSGRELSQSSPQYRPVPQPQQRLSIVPDLDIALSNQNQEFSSPLNTPIKSGPPSRKA